MSYGLYMAMAYMAMPKVPRKSAERFIAALRAADPSSDRMRLEVVPSGGALMRIRIGISAMPRLGTHLLVCERPLLCLLASL